MKGEYVELAVKQQQQQQRATRRRHRLRPVPMRTGPRKRRWRVRKPFSPRPMKLTTVPVIIIARPSHITISATESFLPTYQSPCTLSYRHGAIYYVRLLLPLLLLLLASQSTTAINYSYYHYQVLLLLLLLLNTVRGDRH